MKVPNGIVKTGAKEQVDTNFQARTMLCTRQVGQQRSGGIK